MAEAEVIDSHIHLQWKADTKRHNQGRGGEI